VFECPARNAEIVTAFVHAAIRVARRGECDRGTMRGGSVALCTTSTTVSPPPGADICMRMAMPAMSAGFHGMALDLSHDCRPNFPPHKDLPELSLGSPSKGPLGRRTISRQI
jgi:hypothetical protein